MRSNGIKKLGVVILILLELQLPVVAAPTPMHPLKGHVIKEIQDSVRMGRVPAAEIVELSLVLKLDQVLMDQTIAGLYGHPGQPSSPFLSSPEFAQKFGVADKRKRLKDFAIANGLTVNTADDRADSMIVKVSGRTDQVEKAFNVQLGRYRRPDGKIFRAHETDPTVPETIVQDLSAVVGLSDYTGVARPHLHIARQLTSRGSTAALAPAAPLAHSFTGSFLGVINPSDIHTIYGLNTLSQNGSGQSVAIFELDGYDPADIAFYETQFSLPATPLTFVGVGTTNLCRGVACSMQDPVTDPDMVEVALDIEMVAALVPNAAHIYVYDSPNTFSGVIGQYDRIATDNLAPVVSTSWGAPEVGSSFVAAEQSIFQRMYVQHQGVFAASGDLGAYDNGSTLGVDDPASQTYVTGVGGTSLSGTPSSYTETVWGEPSCIKSAKGCGTGGGIGVGTIPGYQQGISGTASQVFRNVPDVALNADPNSGYAVRVSGSWFQVGGTSAAAPLWAGLMALVNQQRVALGNPILGFANPNFYLISTGAAYATNFHDILSGNNNAYTAHAGYDNATGLGSYNGGEMINALSSVAAYSLLNDLSDVVAYPNPWDIRKNSVRRITIKNLPPGATVRIFTISGLLVKSLPINVDHATWDLTNDAGRTVASGLYIYLVMNNGKKVIGKIAIIK